MSGLIHYSVLYIGILRCTKPMASALHTFTMSSLQYHSISPLLTKP
jgi:hypothetical protein